MAFQILSAVSLLTIMDTFLERMDTVRPKKAMYFGDVSLITSSNVGLELKRSMMNRSITVEYIIMILQIQMYLTFSEIQCCKAKEGNVFWRCQSYYKLKCRARAKTINDESVHYSGVHNHDPPNADVSYI